MSSKLLKNSFIYVFLGFLAPAVNFILVPIYSYRLTTTDFGIITLASLLQAFLTNFTSLGVKNAFSRLFFDRNSDTKWIRSLFTNAFFLQLFAGILIHLSMVIIGDKILGIIFKNNEFTYTKYGIYIGVTAIAINIQGLGLNWYRNQEQAIQYAIWSTIFFIFQALGILIGIVVLNLGAMGNIAGRMWGALIPMVLFLIFIRRLFYFSLELITIAKSMLKFGLPLVPYSLLMLAYNNIDKVLLDRYFDLATLGLYGFAFLIFSVSEIFINALLSAIYPQMTILLTKGKDAPKGELRNIYSMFILVGVFIMVSIASFSGLAIKWFFGENYHPVISFLPLLCLSVVPRIYTMVYSNLINFYKRTGLFSIISAISLVTTFISGLILLPYLGIFGMAIALFIGQSSQFLQSFFYAKKYNYEFKELKSLKFENIISIWGLILIIISTLVYNLYLPSPWIYLGIWVLFMIPLLPKLKLIYFFTVNKIFGR